MSYALVVLMDGLITELEGVDTTLVVVDFDAYDNDPDSASVSPEEAVDKVRSLPSTGTMGEARRRVLLSLADHVNSASPICTFCHLPCGTKSHVFSSANGWHNSCDDCWDERLR